MAGGRASCLPGAGADVATNMSVTGGTEDLRRQHVVPPDTVVDNLVVFKRLVMFKLY
jgi:hypothetical protein